MFFQGPNFSRTLTKTADTFLATPGCRPMKVGATSFSSLFLLTVLFGLLMVLGGIFQPARSEPSPTNLVGPLNQEGTTPGWDFRLLFSAQGRLTHETDHGKDVIRCTSAIVDGTAWHMKLSYTGSHLVENKAYTLCYRARADSARLLRVYGDNAENLPTGLDQAARLSTQWQSFRATFTAHDVGRAENCVPQFWFGQALGTVWLSDVSLVPSDPSSVPVDNTVATKGNEVVQLPPVNLSATTQALELRVLDPATRALMLPEGQGAVIVVVAATGTPWQVQAVLPALTFRGGATYTLSFRARAGARRSMDVVAEVNAADDHDNIGLMQHVVLTPQWQPLAYTFQAAGSGKKPQEVQFHLGRENGSVWLSDIKLSAATPSPTSSPALTSSPP